MRRKILPLESLRGFAAISVALMHFDTANLLGGNAFIRNAHLMVDFFFVLSGFVIFMSTDGRVQSVRDLKNFQTRRFWRLYPLHIAVIFFYFLYKITAVLYVSLTKSSPINWDVINIPQLIANLTMTNAIFKDGLDYNYPSWSISAEFFTYLIFGIILISGRLKWIYAFIVWIVALIYIVLIESGGLTVTSGVGAIMRCFFSFLIGVSTFAVFKYVSKRTPFAGALSFFSTISAILFVSILGGADLDVAAPFIFAATIFFVASQPEQAWFSRFLSLRPFVYLGAISYSVYMVHASVWLVMTTFYRVLFSQFDIFNVPTLHHAMLVILTMTVTFSVASLTYRFIERPFLQGINFQPLLLNSRQPAATD